MLTLLLLTAPPADTVRYTVQVGGAIAGEQVVVREPDSSLTIRYRYADRGRGPDQRVRLGLDDRGRPTALTVTGNDYLKNAVREEFRTTSTGVTWKNDAEEGRGTVGGFYLPLNLVPEMQALLVRALRQAGEPIPVLPDGEARLATVLTRTLFTAVDSVRATLFLVEGLDLTPFPVWFRNDGSTLAIVGGGQAVIRAGFEPLGTELTRLQDSAIAARQAATARHLAERPADGVVFRRVSVFDPESERLAVNMTVVVEGNRITRVGPEGEVEIPRGARQVEGRGRTLLPGLWDMHTHAQPVDGALNLLAGVTSVRDLANDVTLLDALTRRWTDGDALGPRVVKAGIIDGPGPFAGPTKALVRTEAEALAWVDVYADLGYAQVKLYSSLDPALVPAIVSRAHARGLRVSGHVPYGMTAAQAVRAGFDELQHANMLLLNFLAGDSIDTRTPARFTAVGRLAGDLDLDADSVTAFIRLLAERRTVVDPTLTVFEELFLSRPGAPSEGMAEVVPRLPSETRRAFLGGGLPVSGDLDARHRAAFATMLGLVRRLTEAGVPLVAGTDGLAGFTLQRELELYSEAGIPNARVLRIATLDAATIAGQGDQLGSIRRGKLADLVLVDGNPVANITHLRQVALVMKDGALYDPDAVAATVGIRPQGRGTQ